MLLDSDALTRLRDELLQRGGRKSLAPELGESVLARGSAAEVQAIMQRVAPLCEVLYLLMVADGESDADEQDLLRGAIRALTDGALRTSAIDALLRRFEGALLAHGREQRLAQVAAQLTADREDAEAAFMLAAVMTIADRSSSLVERAMLAELRELLGISPQRAQLLLGAARESLG